MNILRTFSNIFIVVGYVACGLFAGAFAGVAVSLGGGTNSMTAISTCLVGGALAGLVFGLRRCTGKKAA
jgi:hypothetical protein